MSIILGQYFSALFKAGDIIFTYFFLRKVGFPPVVNKKSSVLRAMCGVLFLVSKKSKCFDVDCALSSDVWKHNALAWMWLCMICPARLWKCFVFVPKVGCYTPDKDTYSKFPLPWLGRGHNFRPFWGPGHNFSRAYFFGIHFVPDQI